MGNCLTSSRLNAEVEKSAFNLMDLPPELLAHVASFIPSKKLKNFGLVNTKCHGVHQQILNVRLIECVDLRKFFYLDEEKFLRRVKDLQYKRLNLNDCYYLSPWFITELVSRDSLRVLDLTECNCTLEVIQAVVKLNLTTLNISLSKTWRDYFVLSENKSVSVLNGLQNLHVFHKYRCRLMMRHVSRYVLPHCHQLKYLELSIAPGIFKTKIENDEIVQNQQSIATPVPNLETLILNFGYGDLSQHIRVFLEAILYQKKIPLKHIDLRNQTIACSAVSSEILRHQNISFVNAHILRLDGYSVLNTSFRSPYLKGLDVTRVIDCMPKCIEYKTIFATSFYIPNCSLFTEIFVKSGNTSIEAITLRGCDFEDGISYFMDRMYHLSPGIFYLDIYLHNWSETLRRNPKLSNSDLMKSIANFTNLRTLIINPVMLTYSTRKDKEVLESSFNEVTRKCKSLKRLEIVAISRGYSISTNVLVNIKFFENLRELYLVYYSLAEGENSLLSEITKHCSKLKCLHIEEVGNKDDLEEMLVHAKQLKHLLLDHYRYKITKTFVDNLSECTQLQKLYLCFSPDHDLETAKYFAQSLKKLQKLQFLSTPYLDGLKAEYFLSVYNEIKEIRPRFFFKNFEPQPLPMAHRDFIKYSMQNIINNINSSDN